MYLVWFSDCEISQQQWCSSLYRTYHHPRHLDFLLPSSRAVFTFLHFSLEISKIKIILFIAHSFYAKLVLTLVKFFCVWFLLLLYMNKFQATHSGANKSLFSHVTQLNIYLESLFSGSGRNIISGVLRFSHTSFICLPWGNNFPV